MKDRESTKTLSLTSVGSLKSRRAQLNAEEISLFDIFKKAFRHKRTIAVCAVIFMGAAVYYYTHVGTWYQKEFLVKYNNFENNSLFQYIDKILPVGDDDRTDNPDEYASRALTSLSSQDFISFLLDEAERDLEVRTLIELESGELTTPVGHEKAERFIHKNINFLSEVETDIFKTKGKGSFIVVFKGEELDTVEKNSSVIMRVITNYLARREIADIQATRQLVQERLTTATKEINDITNRRIANQLATTPAPLETYREVDFALQAVKVAMAGNLKLQTRFSGMVKEIEEKLFKLNTSDEPGSEVPLLRRELSGLVYQQQLGLLQGMSEESMPIRDLNRHLASTAQKLKSAIDTTQDKRALLGVSNDDIYSSEEKLGLRVESIENLKNQNTFFEAKMTALEQALKDLREQINIRIVKEIENTQLVKETVNKEQLTRQLSEALIRLDLADFKTIRRQEIFSDSTRRKNAMPLSTLLIAAMLLGMASGISIAYTQETRNPALTTIAAYEELGLPVIGSIPSTQSFLISNANFNSNQDHLYGLHYARIGINLLNISNYANSQITLFTAAQSARLSAVALFNLGTFFARTGRRVLMIEADMKNNFISKLVNAPLSGGLDEVYGSSQEINIKPFEIETNLQLLNGDGDTLSSLYRLASGSLLELLTEIKKEYDFILIHSPPCLEGPTAADLSRYAGVSIVCCDASVARISVVERINQELRLFLSKYTYMALENVSDKTGTYEINALALSDYKKVEKASKTLRKAS